MRLYDIFASLDFDNDGNVNVHDLEHHLQCEASRAARANELAYWASRADKVR